MKHFTVILNSHSLSSLEEFITDFSKSITVLSRSATKVEETRAQMIQNHRIDLECESDDEDLKGAVGLAIKKSKPQHNVTVIASTDIESSSIDDLICCWWCLSNNIWSRLV